MTIEIKKQTFTRFFFLVDLRICPFEFAAIFDNRVWTSKKTRNNKKDNRFDILRRFEIPARFPFVYNSLVFSTAKSFFTGRLRIVLVFAILTDGPIISESLLGNTRVTMTILQKCLCTFSWKTSTISLTLTFREFIFNFDVRCVSRKFTTYSCLHLSKNDYWCGLSYQ